MLFPSSPERRHGRRRKALWKGKQYGKSMWIPPRSATTIQGVDRNSASALQHSGAYHGVKRCSSMTEKAVRAIRNKKSSPRGRAFVRFGCWDADHAYRIKAMNSRSSVPLFSSMCSSPSLQIITSPAVTGFSSPLSKYRPVPLRTWYTSKSPTWRCRADGTAGFEHAMVENAALAREILAVEQFRGEDMPFAAFVLHVQFVQFIIMPYHENAPFGP